MHALDKWSNGNSSLTPQRRLMNEALAQIAATEERETRRGLGRLLFALDLTASREATLADARIATAAMIEMLKSIGADRLAMKLVYYRGQECRASRWERDLTVLRRAMEKLGCKVGYTQIEKVLRLALAEKDCLSGVVFIGDVVEEDPDELGGLAAKLGDRNIPLFVFHDCTAGDVNEAVVAAVTVFNQLAELSHGAYCPFGAGSGKALRELLSTIGAFSAGGAEAVKRAPAVATPEARQLQDRLLLGPGGGR